MKRFFPNTSAGGDPDRARLLVQQLWSALELLEQREVSQRELSRYLGLSESSLSDWSHGDTSLHQIEAVLRLLERLPGRWRREMFRSFLREHATLHSRPLAHEPATPGRLRALLKKGKGITFIFGATGSERTWVLTALGHTRAATGPVVGWDARPADWFVPVPGVRYHCDQTLPSGAAEPAELGAPCHPLALQLSNGLWMRFPEHRARLLAAARTRPVLVADAMVFSLPQLENPFPALTGTIDLLELSVPRAGRIHVEFATA